MMVNIQIHYMCSSMWQPATSLHTLYLRPLPIQECGGSLDHHSYSCWRWRYLLLEAVVKLRRKGYAMESDVEENDLDKGDEQLFHYLELCHTEKSCRCISKSVLNHVALTLKDTWMRLEPAARGRINVNWHHMSRPKHPSLCNPAGGWIAKLLLVETRDVRSGNACFQMAVARKR